MAKHFANFKPAAMRDDFATSSEKFNGAKNWHQPLLLHDAFFYINRWPLYICSRWSRAGPAPLEARYTSTDDNAELGGDKKKMFPRHDHKVDNIQQDKNITIVISPI